MAGTKTGPACGIVERTSLPTAMAVMLVEGTKAAIFLLTQAAAAAGDCPILKTSSFVTLTITSISVSESALRRWLSASKRRTLVIWWDLRIATTCSGDGRFKRSVPMFIPT